MDVCLTHCAPEADAWIVPFEDGELRVSLPQNLDELARADVILQVANLCRKEAGPVKVECYDAVPGALRFLVPQGAGYTGKPVDMAAEKEAVIKMDC